MAEVSEQAGVSNCPIINELDDKLPNVVINHRVLTELPTLDQAEKPYDVSQEDSDVTTHGDMSGADKEDTSLSPCTDLLTAFQNGLEHTVALVQHMSREEKSRAWNTLQGLVVNKSLMPPGDSTVSNKEDSCECCLDLASDATAAESSPSGDPAGNTAVSSIDGEVDRVMVTLTQVATPTVACRPVTRSFSLPPVVKQEKYEDVKAVQLKRKRGRSRKTPVENTPAHVSPSGEVLSNTTPMRSRRKRKQCNRYGNNESNDDKIIEPIASSGDLNGDEDKDDVKKQKAMERYEEVKIELGGDDQEKKVTHVTVEKTSAGWRCTICGKVSLARHNLLVHLRIHTGEKPYSCKLCPKKFSVLSNLQRHTKDVHFGYKSFLCNRCDATFHNQRGLTKHIKSEHVEKNSNKKHQCAECGKHFKYLAILKAHMVLHSGDQPFVCSQCSRSFTFRSNLLRHLKIHTGDRPHKCKQCGKGFIERKSLVIHIDRQHLGIKPPDRGHSYMCTICNKTFSSRTSLHTHTYVHSGLKPHACPECGKKFSLSSNMRRHLQTHSGKKPWECSDCQKCFTEKRSLDVHRRLHTGERPYACEICGKTFIQPSTLQSHMPVHSKMRAFSCDKCGKSFLRKSHMNFHMTKHKAEPQFACGFCTKRFYRKYDIDRHLLKHTNEKPFACQLCPKRFSRLQYLKEHLNIHTGARPYKCEHCDMAFADMSSCYKHRKTHTWLPGANVDATKTGETSKADNTLTTVTEPPPASHLSSAPTQSASIVSTVDLQNLRAVENIMSLANVQMIFSAGKEEAIDGACTTSATSADISELDKIVYETLLPSDDLKVLPDEMVSCKDSSDGTAVFKDLSSEQATQLRLALARGLSLEVPEATAAFAVGDSNLATVFIQEGCDKIAEVSVTLSQDHLNDTAAISCSEVAAVDNSESVIETPCDNNIAMVKLAGSISMDNNVIGKLYPEHACGMNKTVGGTTIGPTGVASLVESVSIGSGGDLAPMQLVGTESAAQYYLVLSGTGQESTSVE